MKTNHKSIGRNSGISTVEIVLIITALTIVMTLFSSVIIDVWKVIASNTSKSETSNKIVSGVVKDVRHHGIGSREFIEVKFYDGRVQSFRIKDLPVVKIGALNNFELEKNGYGWNKPYYLTRVVFEENKISGDSDGVEANSHYEPLIEEINKK